MGDAAALFATQGKDTESTKKKKEFVKRTMLWDQDHVALHMLEPFDKSTFGDISDSDLYTLTKEGGTFCKYHSNLCAEGEGSLDRLGIGASQTAQCLAVVIEQLDDKNLAQLLKPELLKLAKDEAQTLKPFVDVLNFGKVGTWSKAPKGFAGFKRQRTEGGGPPKNADVVAGAAEKLYDFLTKEQSPLRGILEILSGNGVFWSGHVATKVAKVTLQQKPMSKPEFVAALVHRSKKGATASTAGSSSDVSGLIK